MWLGVVLHLRYGICLVEDVFHDVLLDGEKRRSYRLLKKKGGLQAEKSVAAVLGAGAASNATAALAY
jgi:hypothetical protein